MRSVKRIMPAHMRACVRPMEDLSINSRLGALTVSQDGSLIVIGLGRSVVVLREDYFEERWLKGPNPNMSDQAIVAQLSNLENDVSVVDIAANNSTVAAAGKEENWATVMRLVEGSSDVQAMYLSRDTQIHGIALSPDGKYISMTGRDRKAMVYDIGSNEWQTLFEFDLTVYLFAYGTCVRFSPGGEYLVVGGDMRKCTVWDVRRPRDFGEAHDACTDDRLVKVLGRGGYINAVCFDSAGQILALTGGDWKVALYDVLHDFALIAEVVMPVQHQHGLAISFPVTVPSQPPMTNPSYASGHPAFAGLIVAAQSGRDSGVLTLTDMATLCPLCELESVNDIGFARGGLLYCRVNGAVHLYDINSSGDAIIPESRLGGRVRAMALNHDGSMIALARMAIVRVYASAHSGVVDEITMPGDVVALAYSPFDTPTVQVVSKLLDRHQIPHELHARIMHDSQLKGKLAALAGKRLLVFAGEPGHLTEVANVKLDAELPPKEEEARHGLRWSADGSMVAVATEKQAVLINTHTGAIVASKGREKQDAWFSIFRLRDEFGPVAAGFGKAAFYREWEIKEKHLKNLMMQLGVVRVQAYAMSHSCAHVAVGGNGRLYIFDTATQEAVFELDNMGWVMGLVWSADDRFVGIGGHNKTVTVLDVGSGVVFADCGVPRSYWPLVLAFSGDGRVVADGNQSFAVYSCDGSRLALNKPLEAAPMLRTSTPIWANDTSATKHEALLVGLVKAHPQIALNALPTKNDGIYRDKGLQPLQDGSARMLDVLIARHKRSLVARLLEEVPALSLLPAPRRLTPSFDLALVKRDTPTLHILLVSACQAPLPLRHLVARELLPRMAVARLFAPIASFLRDPSVNLERSGALIELAHGSARAHTFQLFASWGGVGTHLWDHLDMKREGASGAPASAPTPRGMSQRSMWEYWDYLDLAPKVATLGTSQSPGVHVRPKRVPLPLLTSRGALAAIIAAAGVGAAGDAGDISLFDTPCVRAVVHSLWELQFARLNRVRVGGTVTHLVLALAYAGHMAFAPPASSSFVLQYMRTLLASTLAYFNMQALVLIYLNARPRAGGFLRLTWRRRDHTFAQTVPGALLLIAVVFGEQFGTATTSPAATPTLGVRSAASAGGMMLSVRMGLSASLFLLLERVAHALRGTDLAGLAVPALFRAARHAAPLVLVASAVLASFAALATLFMNEPALDGPSALMMGLAVAAVAMNGLFFLVTQASADLQKHANAYKLRERAALVVEYYGCMSPARRKEGEATWAWVHVLEACGELPPREQTPPMPVISTLQRLGERLEQRMDDLEMKTRDLRWVPDRIHELSRLVSRSESFSGPSGSAAGLS
mmetsp:Transcript_16439/g.50379  ORF Transcript_16439/g.50379 Transcript_16439/m.50379 type:complete len:1342 (+) Transcript_16439:76-4101(+)